MYTLASQSKIMRSGWRYIVLPSLLIANILLGIYIRLINTSLDVLSLEGTDPVRYAYQAKRIVEEGRMPQVDMLRSAPLGEKTSSHLTLYPYVIAVMYKLVSIIPINLRVEQFIIISPVIFFMLTILIVYILAQRLFDDHTALLSVNITIFIPYLLARTKAGFADRDSFVLMVSTSSFLFYVLSHLSDGTKMRWSYTLLSSITMLLTGLTWQGVGVFIAIIAAVEFIKLLIDRSYSYRETAIFASWALPISLGLIFLKPGVYNHPDRPYVQIAVFLPLLILSISIMISITQRIGGLREKLSLHGRLPVGGFLSFLLIAVSVMLFRSKLFHVSKALVYTSIFPFGSNPLFQTIGELQKLGLIGWGLWPGAFWILISIGLLLMVWDVCYEMKLHQLWTMGMVELIIFGIAFSRLSSGMSSANFVETNLTLTIYWASVGIGVLGLLAGFIHAHYKHRIGNPSSPIVWVKIFLIVWCISTLIYLRAAVRFVYLFAIPSALLGGYAITWMFKRCVRRDKENLFYLLLAAAISWQIYALFCDRIGGRSIVLMIYILLAGLTALLVLYITRYTARGGHPILRNLGLTALILYVLSFNSISFHPAFGGYAFSLRNGLPSISLIKEVGAEEALRWLRENTDENAVIAANWELGSWINLLGNRATIVDEQQREYWTYLMARYVFTGEDLTKALEFLKTHKADYLLLTKRDIALLPLTAVEAGIRDNIVIPIFGNIVQRIHISVDGEKVRVIGIGSLNGGKSRVNMSSG